MFLPSLLLALTPYCNQEEAGFLPLYSYGALAFLAVLAFGKLLEAFVKPRVVNFFRSKR